MLRTLFDISKLTGALCSVLSVKPLNERQFSFSFSFSSSIAESLDRRPEPRLLFELSFDDGFCFGKSSLMTPGAEELNILLDSNVL